jgi:hypothetical protein
MRVVLHTVARLFWSKNMGNVTRKKIVQQFLAIFVVISGMVHFVLFYGPVMFANADVSFFILKGIGSLKSV